MIDLTWLSFRSVHENVDFDGFVKRNIILLLHEETRNFKTCPTFQSDQTKFHNYVCNFIGSKIRKKVQKFVKLIFAGKIL